MQETFISVGANIGNREKNIALALGLLAKIPGVRIMSLSSLIDTAAAGGPPQPRYLNGVIKITTTLSARRLLTQLNSIEKSLGRTRIIKNGPRTIDLDILIFGNKLINEPGLVIPHPRMLTRDFVMKPLLEVAPQLTRKWISQKILQRHGKLSGKQNAAVKP